LLEKIAEFKESLEEKLANFESIENIESHLKDTLQMEDIASMKEKLTVSFNILKELVTEKNKLLKEFENQKNDL